MRPLCGCHPIDGAAAASSQTGTRVLDGVDDSGDVAVEIDLAPVYFRRLPNVDTRKTQRATKTLVEDGFATSWAIP